MTTLGNTTIAVTGATGFVGRSLVEHLRTLDSVRVVPLSSRDGDLTKNAYALTSVIQAGGKLDVIFHLAALCGGIGANQARPADFITDNLRMGLNVLDAARHMHVRKVVMVGTLCAFPVHSTWIKPTDLWSGYPEPTNAPYGIAKRTLVEAGKAYREQYGLNVVNVMPTNMYGTCFSDDTEVMTPNGPVGIRDVKVGDNVFTLNPETHCMEVTPVVATQTALTREFFNFSNSRVDFRVTPDHKMYFRSSNEFQKQRAEVFRKRAGRQSGQIVLAHHKMLVDEEKYPDFISLRGYVDEHHIVNEANCTVRDHATSKSKSFPWIFDPRDFMEFLGWYISEGSAGGTLVTTGGSCSTAGIQYGQISIAQSQEANPANHAAIGDCLKRMGVPHGNDHDRWYFTSRLFRNFIKSEIGIGSGNVRIPRFVFNRGFPNELRVLLFDTLMKGDGDKDKGRYSTNSEQLKDDFLFLAFLVGRKCTSVSHDGTAYRICIRKSRENVCVKYRDISVESVEETPVYCITTERNHIIYAGRNGKFNWVGQCDNFDLQTSHVIPALIRKFHAAKLSGDRTVTCWGTGSPTRDFLYVDDAVEAMVLAAEKWNDPEPICIGSGEETSIKAVAEMIRDIVGFDGELRWDLTKPDGQPKRVVATKNQIDTLGFHAKTKLYDGLRQTYEWYLSTIQQPIGSAA